MNLTIRRASRGDAASLTEIARLAKAHWGYPSELLALWEADLTVSPGFIDLNRVYCAVSGRRVIGFYALRTLGRAVELEHLWVRPEAIGQGVGRALLEHAIHEARDMDAREMRIVSDPHAEAFYQRMGARRVGEQDSVPAGRRLPVLLHDLKRPDPRCRA